MNPARYKWAVVGMLWFVCFFNYADRQAIFSVFPKLKTEFGFDPVQLGLIGSAFAWVYAAGAPFAGFVADHFSRKKLILGGCLFWSGVTVLTGWCGRFWHFVAVRALEGLGETFYFPATMSLVSDYHGRATRSRAMAFHQSSVYAGTIGGSWFGAWLAETYGWRVGFYFFGGAGTLLALALWRFLREPVRGASEAPAVDTAGLRPAPAHDRGDTSSRIPEPASASSTGQDESLTASATPLHAQSGRSETGPAAPLALGPTLREIFRRPTALLLLAAFLAANFVATIFLTWTPTFLGEKFGFRLSTAGLSGAVFIHLASALSVPLGGWLADVWARRSPGGRILVQAAGLLAGAPFIVLVGMTGDVFTLLAAMTVFGACKGLYDANIFAALFDVIEPRARATAAGIMNTVGWGGGALGPVAVGLATKYGRHARDIDNMSEAIALGGVIYLVAAAVLLVAAFGFARRDVAPASTAPCPAV